MAGTLSHHGNNDDYEDYGAIWLLRATWRVCREGEMKGMNMQLRRGVRNRDFLPRSGSRNEGGPGPGAGDWTGK